MILGGPGTPSQGDAATASVPDNTVGVGVGVPCPASPHELLARHSTAELCEWRPDRDPHAYSTSTIGRAKCPSGYPGWDEDRDGPLTFLVGAMARAEIEAML